ncbi:MAG: hypothetical protein J5841_09725 [Clostridia bacterium]|nr:hypothetical protein [Clostridia bacterium]
MDKTQFSNKVLHYGVIPMGIDPKMTALFISPVDAERADTFFRTVRSNPVHNAIGAVIQPISICDIPVCRFNVRSMDKEKGEGSIERPPRHIDISAARINQPLHPVR